MSLRTRLAVAAAAAVAAAVVLASIIVYFVVRNSLFGPINSGLRTTVTQIRIPPDTQGVPLSGHRANEYVLAGFGLERGSGFLPFRLVKSDGATYYPPNGLALEPLPVTALEKAVASGSSKPFFSDAHVDGQHARIYTIQFQPGFAVQLAASTDAADHALSRIKLWLTLVAIGGIGIASAAGFLVARAALKPVRRLSDAADTVRATRDLSQRIEVTGNDELSRLATTFNAMLASLDEAAQRQRRLVQDASHELRTPLTSLRTNIEVLASDPVMTAEEREHLLTDVVEQLTEMTALIGELTELARGEEQQLDRQDVRLDLITKEAIRRTTRNYPDVPILADLAPTAVVGVPATLERAIANLLDNAAKWSPPGAHVSVTLRDGELVVRDRGPGIADADLPHVFERFYRATAARSRPGSGLGLAIVKQVADSHGGAVTAERAPDPQGGTLMRFRIPSHAGPAPARELVAQDLASS